MSIGDLGQRQFYHLFARTTHLKNAEGSWTTVATQDVLDKKTRRANGGGLVGGDDDIDVKGAGMLPFAFDLGGFVVDGVSNALSGARGAVQRAMKWEL